MKELCLLALVALCFICIWCQHCRIDWLVKQVDIFKKEAVQ